MHDLQRLKGLPEICGCEVRKVDMDTGVFCVCVSDDAEDADHQLKNVKMLINAGVPSIHLAVLKYLCGHLHRYVMCVCVWVGKRVGVSPWIGRLICTRVMTLHW